MIQENEVFHIDLSGERHPLVAPSKKKQMIPVVGARRRENSATKSLLERKGRGGGELA